ncbi:DNA polymerase eta [Chironomus tepperi]|uniref:DNA polymerase eta n=1 Tax=Chironomus tepperi TaxID=113505 RepID=UPI00391F291B
MTSSKSYITLKEKYDRVIVLIDMDCFYCQVEELLDPTNLGGKPIAVVQYTENAGIIAVNYAARALGVTRHMRENEAKAACPNLVCVKVPSKFNKADISKYRDAGKRVADVFETFTKNLERASIDEAYMDITEMVAERVQKMREKSFTLTAQHLHNTYIVGYDNIGKFIQEVSMAVDKSESCEDESYESSKLRLLIGASIVSDIRRAVKEQTGYTCSAGIAHNKILAKLVCGMNKPNKQTVLPIDSVKILFETLEIHKIKSMGGKIGEEVCKKLGIKLMCELLPFEEADLHQHFGPRIGNFLYLIARGIDLEKVERKVMSKSIAVSKNFRGKNEIMNVNTLKYWLKELSKELKERLDKDHEETNRLSKQMIVQFTQMFNKKGVSSSRTVPLNGKSVNSFTSDEIGEEAFKTIEKNTTQLVKAEGTFLLSNNINHLGISAGKLEDANAGQGSSKSVQDLLKNHAKKSPKVPKSEKSTTESDNLFAKFEYNPKAKIVASKSENATVKLENPVVPKVRQTKSEDNKEAIVEDKGDDLEPQANIKEQTRDLCQKSSIKFTSENAIKGEKTLKHWMLELFIELDEKVQKVITDQKVNPSLIKLNWKQIRSDGTKDMAEEIPTNIFTNGINVDFFINLIKDSGQFDPISLIELEAAGFSSNDEFHWKMNFEESSADDSKIYKEEDSVPEINESLTELENETKEEIPNPQLSDELFNDDDVRPSSLLDLQLEVDDDEEEILKLERSFLGLSPVKSKENEPLAANGNNSKNIKLDEAGPSHKALSNIKEEDEAVPSCSYASSYIELQKPHNVSDMLDILNPLEECLECGKMIRKLDMITHIDGHIAMQISMTQREEYRAEQKRKLLQKIDKKSTQKSQKPKPATTSKPSQKPIVKAVTKPQTNLIEKFTKKESLNDTSWENSILCDQCNQLIEIDNIQMHQDYHFAQQLRMDQMKVNTITSTNSATKRKRPCVSKKDTRSAKSLKEYFKE